MFTVNEGKTFVGQRVHGVMRGNHIPLNQKCQRFALLLILGVAPQHRINGARNLYFGSFQIEESSTSALTQAPAAETTLPELTRSVARSIGAVIKQIARLASAMRAAQGRRSMMEFVTSHDSRHFLHLAFLFSNPNVTGPLPDSKRLDQPELQP
ncbi:MAG: hypothetical protein H7Y30_16420 [Pyrinomonadaceae bacterium]|nr:hypothetical protein [Pyrinomonadaceae bacterium]